MQSRREFDAYLQFDLSKSTYSSDEYDNPLLFWKAHELLMPNLSKLAKKIFNILASSAGGFIISQRRTNLSPSTVNDIMLVRSAATYLNNKV